MMYTQKDTYCLLATQIWYLVSFQGIWGCFVPRMDIIKHQIELFSGVWYIFIFLLQRKTKTLHRNWHAVKIVQITKPDVCGTTFPFTGIHSEVLPVCLLFGPCGLTSRDTFCLLATQRLYLVSFGWIWRRFVPWMDIILALAGTYVSVYLLYTSPSVVVIREVIVCAPLLNSSQSSGNERFWSFCIFIGLNLLLPLAGVQYRTSSAYFYPVSIQYAMQVSAILQEPMIIYKKTEY